MLVKLKSGYLKVLEENLGLTNHGRVVIEHKKYGRVHYHVLWDRFSPEGGRAKNMGNDYAAHQKTQKQLEHEFNLRPMMAKGRNFRDWEVKWAKRYGYDIFALRNDITAAFNKAKSGKEFHEVLKDKGCVLFRGGKGQFVLILPWGQHKALSSMMYGRPIKRALNRALSDIDIGALSTVDEGKALVRGRLPKRSKSGRIKPALPSKTIASAGSAFPKYYGFREVNAKSQKLLIYAVAPIHSDGDARSQFTIGAFTQTSLGKSKSLKCALIQTSRQYPSEASLGALIQVRKTPSDGFTKNRDRSMKPTSVGFTSFAARYSETPVLQVPVTRMHNPSRGWPAAAILDWETWGQLNPARFFAMWPELTTGGLNKTF